jgi:hypothetical protein
VPPDNQHSLLYAFAILEVTATLGVLVLLVVGAFTKRLRANIVLLNLELVFFVTAAGQSLLVWTGHSFDKDPPRGLCLISGSFIAAAASMKAGAAFALTCKVCSTPMSRFFCSLVLVGLGAHDECRSSKIKPSPDCFIVSGREFSPPRDLAHSFIIIIS